MSSIVTVKVGDIQKNIPINKFERISDFKSRVATEFGTLPRLLYFDQNYENINEIIQQERPVVLTDLLIESKKSSGFEDLYMKLREPILDNRISVKDVLLLSVLNSTIEDRFLKLLLQESVSRLGLDSIDFQTVDDIIDNKRSETEVLFNSIQDHSRKTRKNNRILKEFLEGSSDFVTTDFYYESIKLEAFTTSRDISIMELFNRVKTNTFAPFSNVKELNVGGGSTVFSKIFKEKLPYEAWSETKDDNLILKVLDKVSPLKTEEDDFSSVFFSKVNETVKAEMLVPISKISQAVYIDRVRNSFVPIISFDDIRELNITGTYNLMNQKLDKNVLADLVMNSILQKYSVINESVSATKVKNSTFVYFDVPNVGKAKVNFTPKIVTRKDFVKGYDLGTPYVRIRVKEIENEEKLNLLKEFINKFFTYYNKEYDKVVRYYRQYIPNFGKEAPIEIEDEDTTSLKKQVPDLFISGYSGQCPKNKNPVVIADTEVEAARTDGFQVMTYPKLDDSSGQSRNYICRDERYSYPGLQKNNLSNKDVYQYLPCCFSKDQTTLAGSNYRAYYLDEVPEKTDTRKRYILQSNKSVREGEVATLPDNLNDMFTIINKRENVEYLRKGVKRSPSSFLECVVSALGYEIPIDIKVTRDSLANSETIGACKQEMYDFSNVEIIDLLKSSSYLDPKLFVHLLEEQFNCNIFLFSSVKNTDGEMITPRFTEGYYQNFNSKPYVLVYENGGSRSENLSYPQCEIIIAYDKTILTRRNIKESYNPDTPLIIQLNEIFNKLSKAYSLNAPIEKSNIVYPDYSQILNQVTDSNGKTRKFNFTYKEEVVTMYTDPIQPISVESVALYPDNKTSLSIAIEICNQLNIVVKSQSIDVSENVKFLNGDWGGVKVSFPVLSEPKYNYIDSVVDTSVFQDEVISSYSVFVRNQKNARYISEYFLWFYSTYIKSKGYGTDLSSIVNFVQEQIEVDTGFIYGNIGKMLSATNSAVVKNGKLVVSSTELLRRLIFYLKLMIVRNKKMVIDYYQRTMIQNYYINVTDFTKYQNQIVLEGEEGVIKFLLYSEGTKTLSGKVKPLETKPYFFRNTLISDDIKLLQDTGSLKYATQLGSIWNTEGYNNFPLRSPTYEPATDVTLYSYRSQGNITEYDLQIGSVESKTGETNEVSLLGYKYEDKPRFASIFTV